MGPMAMTQPDIGARVKAQYEAFPYPHYPLWIPLGSQEAYASNSLFAARLSDQGGGSPAIRRGVAPRVLLAGCGDVFPYMATFWEPRAHRLTALDLSARSLRRARLRCLPRLRGIEWRQGNLEDTEADLSGDWSHIDCYGVLHHLADPGRVLRRFGALLASGGTARIMVYNSGARAWIRHLQKAFGLLGLTAFDRGEREAARGLLDALAALSPGLAARFAHMPGDSFANPARFVDTFLHAREARLGASYWQGAIAAAGLRVTGLFDRYGELDDLPNPLLRPPALADLEARISDRRFENNLELYLAKPGTAGDAGPGAMRALPSPQAWRPPPRVWSGFPEIDALTRGQRRRVWAHGIARLSGLPAAPADAWAGIMPPRALQRLARLGALFPDDFRSAELRALLIDPMEDFMEPPETVAPGAVRQDRGLRARVEALLRERGRDGKLLEAVMRRLDAAQRP